MNKNPFRFILTTPLDTLRHWWNNNPAEVQAIADQANQAIVSRPA